MSGIFYKVANAPCVRRRVMRFVCLPTSFQPPPSEESPSSELGWTNTSSSSTFLFFGGVDVASTCRGGGGISIMNQSCCAIKNSRTFWLKSCSFGDISWSGCDISPGRKITARSWERVNIIIFIGRGWVHTWRCHEVLVWFPRKHRQEIKYVKEEILICAGHLWYQFLACRYHFVMVEWFLC